MRSNARARRATSIGATGSRSPSSVAIVIAAAAPTDERDRPGAVLGALDETDMASQLTRMRSHTLALQPAC